MVVVSSLVRSGFILAASIFVVVLPSAADAYSPEEQAACQDDAFRVCGAYIPDIDRVTACMVQNRSQLSPGCRVYFRDPEPPPVMARKPVKPKPAAKAAPKASAKSSAAKSKKPE